MHKPAGGESTGAAGEGNGQSDVGGAYLSSDQRACCGAQGSAGPGSDARANRSACCRAATLRRRASDFEKAKIEAARADLQLQRAKDLLQHEVMAQRDYDDLKAMDDADHAELERARQASAYSRFLRERHLRYDSHSFADQRRSARRGNCGGRAAALARQCERHRHHCRYQFYLGGRRSLPARSWLGTRRATSRNQRELAIRNRCFMARSITSRMQSIRRR